MITTPMRPTFRPKISRTLTASLYALAVVFYFIAFGKVYSEAWQLPEILITPIMALGSFVAGSTFLGGGAVAFPALTKILGADPITAKNFSLAIQSVGMTSASIYILLRVPNIPWQFFFYYLPASVIGLLLSVSFFESYLAASDLRISFTLFILVFLLVYLWAYANKQAHFSDIGPLSRFDKNIIIKAGLLGGILSGLLGSGADLVAFCLLALYFRMDIKLATQTSVVIMAAVSIAGVLAQGVLFQNLSNEVLTLWLLAAPVVLIGAPLGAVFCRRVTTRSLLVFISVIVLIELTTTLWLIPIQSHRIPFYLLLILFSISLLVFLYKISSRKQHTQQHIYKSAD